MMNRKSKTLFSISASALLLGVTLSQLSSDDHLSAFCGKMEPVVINSELPVSHPINKCAAQKSQGVSWSSWMTGRSSSYQFHFIDLLELLSRSNESAQKNPASK